MQLLVSDTGIDMHRVFDTRTGTDTGIHKVFGIRTGIGTGIDIGTGMRMPARMRL